MKKLPGSYTVEAALVMTTVLCTMGTLIHFAYRQCRQATGNMRLHNAVEIFRHEEEMRDFPGVDTAAYQIQVERRGKRVVGTVQGKDWSMTIESGIFEPEEFLRLLTMIPEKDEE